MILVELSPPGATHRTFIENLEENFRRLAEELNTTNLSMQKLSRVLGVKDDAAIDTATPGQLDEAGKILKEWKQAVEKEAW